MLQYRLPPGEGHSSMQCVHMHDKILGPIIKVVEKYSMSFSQAKIGFHLHTKIFNHSIINSKYRIVCKKRPGSMQFFKTVVFTVCLRRVMSPIHNGLPHSTVLHCCFDAVRVPSCVFLEDVNVCQSWSTRSLVSMFWCPENHVWHKLLTSEAVSGKPSPSFSYILLIFGRLSYSSAFVMCCFQWTFWTVLSMCV